MAKNLVIVESPAKAKTIKKYLGKDFEVMASMGHLRDLPKSQLGVDIENDFEPRYITIRGKGELLGKLKKDAKAAKRVYLAADPDREGEAISWHLAQCLEIDPASKCRITFNEITKNAVKAAVKDPKEIDINLVNAQQARRILDRIVGYKLSPLLWKKVKKGLSAGRVQSAVTGIVVDREREIEKFIPEEYWTIEAKLTDDKGKNAFKAKFHGMGGKKTAIADGKTAEEILAKAENAKYIIKTAKYGEKKKAPQPPFTTSTLQQEASRRLGFTSKRTMAAAQTLYEGVDIQGHGTLGLITYMRTDSLRISAEAMSAAADFINANYGKEFLPASPRYFKTGKAAQDAHEAIRPTDVTITPEIAKATLSADQYKLYKLIWERFMASQMAVAVYSTLGIDIDADGLWFKASFSKVKFKGYEFIYEDGREEEDVNHLLPSFAEGQELLLSKIMPEQHFTEPPSRYTEGSLIKAMEERGIGRPSTYAPTITTILARGYVVREKKLLKPTELGYVTTDLMKEYFSDIVNVEFTADMEERLDKIEDGDLEWVTILKDFYGPFSDELSHADSVIGKVEVKDEESDEICEKCGRKMVYKMGRFGKFLACPGFPQCRNAKPIIVDTGVECPKCGGKITERKSQKGKKYYACENSAKCGTVLWDMPSKEVCEKCGSVKVIKNSKNGKKTVCPNKECEENAKK